MRKRRAIITIKNPRLRYDITRYLAARGYDTVVFGHPTGCPVYGDSKDCTGPHSCGDIMIMNFDEPVMSGVKLIAAQQWRGCKLPAVNKAVIAESIPDEGRAALATLGVALFHAPLAIRQLEQWVAECETRIDLSRTVAVRRREERR